MTRAPVAGGNMEARARGGVVRRYLFGAERHRARPRRNGARAWLRRGDVRFGGAFVSLAFGGWLVHSALEQDLAPVARGTQAAVERVGDGLGLGVATFPDGTTSFGGGSFAYDLTVGCTGLYIGMLFAAAVLAYPARAGQRLAALLVGLPLLFVVNVARLLSMGWLGLRYPAAVDAAHMVAWQAILVVVVGLGWLAWVRLVVDAARAGAPRPGLRRVAASGGLFVGVVGLAVLAARAGGIDRYAAFVSATVALVTARDALAPPAFGAAAEFFYATLAGSVALFLATPTDARRRLAGALAWGGPVAFLAALFARGIDDGARAVGGGLLGLTMVLGIVAPLASWCAWLTQQGLLSVSAARKVARCPACGRSTEDLVAHAQDAHKGERRLLRRALREDAARGHDKMQVRPDAQEAPKPPGKEPRSGSGRTVGARGGG